VPVSPNAREHLIGLIAAPFTPMDGDGDVNLPVVEKLAALFARNGVAGAFVCGTTGEGLSLTTEERMRLAERWVEAAQGEFAVIVHAGHASMRETQALVAHAAGIGATAIAVLPPIYYRPASIAELAAYLAEAASTAPSLPMYYYHIPSLSQVHVPVCDLLLAAADRAPNLAGAKYTFEDLADYGRCVDLLRGRFDMLFGRDEMLLGALAVGGRGAVGTTYGFAAPLYLRLIEAFNASDLPAARALQAKSREMIAIMRRHGGLPAGKAMIRLVGMDCGPCRPPLRTLSVEQAGRLRADLEPLGFFDFCCR